LKTLTYPLPPQLSFLFAEGTRALSSYDGEVPPYRCLFHPFLGKRCSKFIPKRPPAPPFFSCFDGVISTRYSLWRQFFFLVIGSFLWCRVTKSGLVRFCIPASDFPSQSLKKMKASGPISILPTAPTFPPGHGQRNLSFLAGVLRLHAMLIARLWLWDSPAVST